MTETKLYRVTDPNDGGALIMIAPMATIGAAFGGNYPHAVVARVEAEVAARGITEIHFNGKRIFGFTQVDVSAAS